MNGTQVLTGAALCAAGMLAVERTARAGGDYYLTGPTTVVGTLSVQFKAIYAKTGGNASGGFTWAVDPPEAALYTGMPGVFVIWEVDEPTDIVISGTIGLYVPTTYYFNVTVLPQTSIVPVEVLHVDQSAAGVGDGSSWADAFTTLQDALAVAGYGTEVRVAQGVHRPDEGANVTPGDREASFWLIDGVMLKGGYAGLAGDDPDARDWELYETILCGDIGVEDDPLDNSFHVVRGDGLSPDTFIDGFTIRRGRADDVEGGHNFGGGMLLSGSPRIRDCLITENYAGDLICYPCLSGDEGDGGECGDFCQHQGAGGGLYGGSPTIESTVFRNNAAANGGGARLIGYSLIIDSVFEENKTEWYGSGGGLNITGTFLIDRCTFRENLAFDSGGGMNVSNTPPTGAVVRDSVFEYNTAWNWEGAAVAHHFDASPLYIGCTFRYNLVTAGARGAFSARFRASPTVVNSIFIENHSTQDSPAIRLWGFGSGPTGGLHATFINCLIAGNTANRHGAGIHADQKTTVTIINCTIVDNHAAVTNSDGKGGGVYSPPGSSIPNTLIHNSLIWGNTDATGDGESAQLGAEVSPTKTAVTNSIVEHWSGLYSGVNNTGQDPLFANPANGDFRPLAGSPAIDGGDNVHVPLGVTTDLAGNPRIIDGLEDGQAIVDIGAYEFDPADPPAPPIPGDLNGDGSVGVADLLLLLAAWGRCDDCAACPADLTGDCAVGVGDLLILLANWG